MDWNNIMKKIAFQNKTEYKYEKEDQDYNELTKHKRTWNMLESVTGNQKRWKINLKMLLVEVKVKV